MGTPFKLWLDDAAVDAIADRYAAAWSGFPRDRFVALGRDGLDALELLDRGRHLGQALGACLPADDGRALRVFLDAMGPTHGGEEAFGDHVFRYLPDSAWLSTHGYDHWELGMRAHAALTQRFTAEFSLRPWIVRFQDRVLAQCATWVHDESAHVRRMVSEATRPRLPWGGHLRALIRDPRPTLPLLTALRDDPSAYVRRSVANHLGDIGKDHPDLLLDVARDWSTDAPEPRRQLLAHALRVPVKQGHPVALALVGADVGADLRASATVRPAQVRIGDKVQVEVVVHNPGEAPVAGLVDLVVHFVQKTGTGAKVFKGWKGTVEPGAELRFRVSVSLAVHTTRAPRPGTHRVDLRVCGRTEPGPSFEVLPA